MTLPSDILLPNNAKFFGFIDPKNELDLNYDITWSFQYSLSGNNQSAFCTFLTNESSPISGYPGHYLGVLNGDIITTEESEPLETEEFDPFELEEGVYFGGKIFISFDTSGLFALETIGNSGVTIDEVLPNSLIVRSDNTLLFNQPLSVLSSDFSLKDDNFKTLRFRYSGAGKKLSIDWRNEGSEYELLTSIQISDTRVKTDVKVYPGFTYTSPVSSSDTSVNTFKLKNFHIHGVVGEPTTESTTFTPLTSELPTEFTNVKDLS